MKPTSQKQPRDPVLALVIAFAFCAAVLFLTVEAITELRALREQGGLRPYLETYWCGAPGCTRRKCAPKI